MTTSSLGNTTIQALRCLKSSGEKSFEKLTAILLSRLVGVPIRLCKSGYQAGIDAIAEIPFAVEDKRYQNGNLDQTELLGKLTDAARSHPDLQLWVLASTVALDAFCHTALRETAEMLGLGILVLDKEAAEPELSEVDSIVALGAIDIEATLSAIGDPEWIDDRFAAGTPPIYEVKADLLAIASHSGFADWKGRLRANLAGLPLWQLIVRRQNRRLLQMLEGSARESFGTAFDRDNVVPRTAENKINEWLNSAIEAPDPEIAIVLGERFDGKTWCVFDWLRNRLATLPLLVFFIGSNQGINSAKSLEDHIFADVKRVLGSSERHAEATVRRQRDIKAGTTPWCLVVLDGLNEYFPNFDKCLEHISYASGRVDLDARPCAVLATIRQQSWEELGKQIQAKKQAIKVGPYDDAEFQVALRLRGLPDDYLASLPDTVRPLVRRPRYLGLVIDHKDQLGSYDAITPNVLHWLDACDKIARSRPAPAPRWDVESYQEALKNLATCYFIQGALNLTEVHSTIGTLASDPRSALEDLRSEGVLVKTGSGYKVASDRLALGMGVYLLERLEVACEKGQSLVECLRDLLAPAQETEEMISWLRAAAAVALLRSLPTSEEVLDTLINEWLRSRNLSRQDFQEIRAVRRLLLRPLLRLAEETWSFETGEPRLQELSRMVFTDALTEHKDLISEAVRFWFRLVPRAGSATLQHLKKENDPEGIVRVEVAEEDLADLNLRIWGDEGILMLHRVGLHLVNKIPDLVEPKDLLALLVAKAIAFDGLGDGDLFVLRRALAQGDTIWFAAQVKQALEKPAGRRRKSLSSLISCADRADLVEFAEAVKLSVDPQWELWNRGQIRNRSRYEEVHFQPFAEEDNPGHFIREVQGLVCDPILPRPCNERLATIREVLTRTFADVELGTSRSQTVEDAEFERMLPAMAAWAPDIGADIVRCQMMNLPKRIDRKPLWWALRLKTHTALAEGSARSALVKALSVHELDNTEGQVAIGAILLVLFPAMSQAERVEALLNHPLKFEWTELYLLAARLLNEEGKTYLLTYLHGETDPSRLRRICYLLNGTDEGMLSEEDVEPLVSILVKGDDKDRLAAFHLAAIEDIKNIPLELLLSSAANSSDQQSLLPDYASWLLVNGEALKKATYVEMLSRLRPRWRAFAATKREDFRCVFLQEVEQGLMPEGVASQTSLQTPIHIELQGDDTLPELRLQLSPELSQVSFHFRRPETTTGGTSWLENDSPGDIAEAFEGTKASAERFNNLQREAREKFFACCGEHQTCWIFEKFPQALIKHLYGQDRSRFEKWLSWLLVDKKRARNWWGGLLVPMFQVTLHAGDPCTKEIWELVSPFQRNSSQPGARFVIGGIHWAFHELSSEAANEEIAIALLKELVCRSLSDEEMFHIALGARHQGQQRLAKILDEFFRHERAEMRARAVKIAGWLEGMAEPISRAERSDSSLWVRKVAADAFKSQQLETWARHWLDVFLKETRTEIRWGAGQLFLACIDSRFHAWAWQIIRQPGLTDRIRGEAFLLLDEARRLAEDRDQKLRDTFLQHKLNDLRAVCDPWHPSVDWEQLATT